MHNIFNNKKILILVSGSIAVYKMLDCISRLTKYGACIKVVMSKESEKFVTPLSFEAMSHEIVLHEKNQSWQENGANHISYAKWADILLLAPASANTIAKAAYGIADNVLLSTLLATQTPKLLAPAMNTAMLNATQTQRNLTMLAQMGYEIISPRRSLLACGDEGEGALANTDEILFYLARAFMRSDFWTGRRVIVTGGGSREKIDDVRYLSNYSSGKQAAYLARALYVLGADVWLISSSIGVSMPLGVKCVQVESVKDYEAAIRKALDCELNEENVGLLETKKARKSVLFMAAALADYAPLKPHSGKLKKEQLGHSLRLECVQNPDVLAAISHDYKDSVYKVGFKAELDSHNASQSACAMLEKKGCDMVCLNVITPNNPFGGERNSIEVFTQTNEGHKESIRFDGSKFEVALFIANRIEKMPSMQECKV